MLSNKGHILWEAVLDASQSLLTSNGLGVFFYIHSYQAHNLNLLNML